jgi:hypothetical protein
MKNQARVVLGANRRALSIVKVGAPSAFRPTLPGYNTNSGYYWNGRAWVKVATPAAKPSKSTQMAPGPITNLEQLWAKLFGAIPGNPGDPPQLAGTNPFFSPPAAFSNGTASPGSDLSSALGTLTSTYDSNGVPSEHVYDATCAAFQTSWNADPTVTAAGGNATLDTDGCYGPNTHDAVASINGGTAPDVNTAQGGSPAPETNTPGGYSSNIVEYWNSLPLWEQIAIGVAGVGGAVAVGKALYGKHGAKVGKAVRHHASKAHHALRHHAARLHSHVTRRAH